MYLMTRDKKYLPKIHKPLRKQPKKATQGYHGPIRTLADVEREEEFIRQNPGKKVPYTKDKALYLAVNRGETEKDKLLREYDPNFNYEQELRMAYEQQARNQEAAGWDDKDEVDFPDSKITGRLTEETMNAPIKF